MKTSLPLKSLLTSMAIATSATVTLTPATTQAGVSANMGAVSTYVFRGLKQTDAAGQAGLDYENDSGFYAGTWGSQVGAGNNDEDGLEYDLYAGWSGSVGAVDLGVGYTGYFYTNGFDETYNELNLSAGFNGITLAFNPGLYDDTNADGDSETQYYNVAISGDIGPIAATLGYNDWDLSTSDTEDGGVNIYLELSYSRELIKGFDGSITYVGNQQEDAEGDSYTQNYLILGIATSFDVM